MATLSASEQFKERAERMRRKKERHRNQQEEANHAPDEVEDDQDVKMENNTHSNSHPKQEEDSDEIHRMPPDIDLVSNSDDENDEISFQPQIETLQQEITKKQARVNRLWQKYQKEAQELSELEAELEKTKRRQSEQFNNARIHSQSNGHRHQQNRHMNHTPNHRQNHRHRQHDNHSASPNHTNSVAATPQLVRDERHRQKKQEEHDLEVAMKLQREFDRAERQRDQQQQRSSRPNQNSNSSSNHHHHHHHHHGNSFDDPFSVFENDPFFREHRQRRNHNHHSNSDLAGFGRSPFGVLHSSPFASSSAFDAAPFEAMRVHMNAMNMHRMPSGFTMFQGLPADIDNMSFKQLSTMFPNMPRGANEESIQRLPTDTFQRKEDDNNDSNNNSGDDNRHHRKKKKKKKKEEDDKNKCCICLEQFESGDEIRRLPCMHIFHKDEIDKWLRSNRVCPICRINIEEH